MRSIAKNSPTEDDLMITIATDWPDILAFWGGLAFLVWVWRG